MNCIETKSFSFQDFMSSYGPIKHLAAHALQYVALEAREKCR